MIDLETRSGLRNHTSKNRREIQEEGRTSDLLSLSLIFGSFKTVFAPREAEQPGGGGGGEMGMVLGSRFII